MDKHIRRLDTDLKKFESELEQGNHPFFPQENSFSIPLTLSLQRIKRSGTIQKHQLRTKGKDEIMGERVEAGKTWDLQCSHSTVWSHLHRATKRQSDRHPISHPLTQELHHPLRACSTWIPICRLTRTSRRTACAIAFLLVKWLDAITLMYVPFDILSCLSTASLFLPNKLTYNV